MNVLLFARGRPLLERIATLLEQHEVRASITIDDEDALHRLGADRLDAVVIGGGVEPPSRARIVEAATLRGILVINGAAKGKDLADYVRDDLIPALRAKKKPSCRRLLPGSKVARSS